MHCAHCESWNDYVIFVVHALAPEQEREGKKEEEKNVLIENSRIVFLYSRRTGKQKWNPHISQRIRNISVSPRWSNANSDCLWSTNFICWIHSARRCMWWADEWVSVQLFGWFCVDLIEIARTSRRQAIQMQLCERMNPTEEEKTDDAKLAPIKCVWSAVSDSIYLNGRESSSFSASHSLDAALFFISCFTRNSAVWSRSRSALSSAIWFICECARQFFSDVFFCFCFFLSFLLLLFIRWMCVSPATPVVAFTILELFIRFRIQIERIIWIERERCVRTLAVSLCREISSCVGEMSCVGFCSEYLLLIIQMGLRLCRTFRMC